MRLHALSIALVLMTSSSSVDGFSQSLGSNVDHNHQRRDDSSDDFFTGEAGDDMGLLTDENGLFQDGSSSENLDDLQPFTTDPTEEMAQSSSCEQPLEKREDTNDDWILGKYQYSIFRISNPSYRWQESLLRKNNYHIGKTSDSCPSDDTPSSPDFSNLNFGSYDEFLERVDPDSKPPPKTGMSGLPLAPILPYMFMSPKYECPPPKVLVCCTLSGRLTQSIPSLCGYCE